MSDHAALIAEARNMRGVYPSHQWQYKLLTGLADALEAVQQTPAVDREALARVLNSAFMSHVTRNGFESDTYGALADAAMEFQGVRSVSAVKAEALEEAAERVRYELGTEASGHTSTYSARKWLFARAQQVREGN